MYQSALWHVQILFNLLSLSEQNISILLNFQIKNKSSGINLTNTRAMNESDIFSQDIFFNYLTLHYIMSLYISLYLCKICNFIRITSLNSTASQQYHVLNQIIYYWAKKKMPTRIWLRALFSDHQHHCSRQIEMTWYKDFFFFRYLLIT